jgi:hypothetical protein
MSSPARSYNNLDVTPTMVALSLLELSRALADATKDLDEIEQAVVDADEAYVLAESKWMLEAKTRDDLTSDPLRKAWVAPKITGERLARETAKAIVRARKLKIDTIKTRVTIGQTVCNALQSEINLQQVRSR